MAQQPVVLPRDDRRAGAGRVLPRADAGARRTEARHMNLPTDYERILAVAESFRSAGLEVARAGPTRAGLSFIGVSNRAALPGLETSRFVPLVRFMFKDFKFVDGEANNCTRRWPSREEFMRDPVVAAT